MALLAVKTRVESVWRLALTADHPVAPAHILLWRVDRINELNNTAIGITRKLTIVRRKNTPRCGVMVGLTDIRRFLCLPFLLE